MLLYLHIPFCDSKCHYCAFNSYTTMHYLKEKYMSAILRQFEFELDRFKVSKNSIDTLFIGGGTPSTLSPKLYEPFFKLISPYIKQDAEITSEANPNSATLSWLEGMRDLGVNRISFGVQSFDEKKLKLLNRSHSKKEAIQAINNAQKVGFKHISLDLIYGVKGDSLKLIESDLVEAFKLPIDHISAYSLTIEENTRFWQSPEIKINDEEIAKKILKEITKRGFSQYEISNFGIYHSRHNLGYWKLEDYIGLGSGAVGFLKDRRFYTLKDPAAYIKDPNHLDIEHIKRDELVSEKVLLGLRSKVGFAKELLNSKQKSRTDLLIKEKRLEEKDGKIYNLNYLLSDEIALYIL